MGLLEKITDSELKKLYLVEKFNDYQIADKLKVSRSTLRQWRKEKGISPVGKLGFLKGCLQNSFKKLEEGATLTEIAKTLGVNRRTLSKNFIANGFSYKPYRKRAPDSAKAHRLSVYQREILVGEIFGDGNLTSTSKNRAYYRCHHSLKQHFFVKWKAEAFQPLTSLCKITNQKTAKMKTWTCFELSEIRKIFYPTKGSKKLSGHHVFYLTPRSLGVWYMGDGSLNGIKGILNTGINNEGENIANNLTDKFGFVFRCFTYVYKKSSQHQISAESNEKFFELITPYVLKNFSYKIPKSFHHLLETKINETTNDC